METKILGKRIKKMSSKGTEYEYLSIIVMVNGKEHELDKVFYANDPNKKLILDLAEIPYEEN